MIFKVERVWRLSARPVVVVGGGPLLTSEFVLLPNYFQSWSFSLVIYWLDTLLVDQRQGKNSCLNFYEVPEPQAERVFPNGIYKG